MKNSNFQYKLLKKILGLSKRFNIKTFLIVDTHINVLCKVN